MEKRNLRKERIGVVTSNKMDKSIVVAEVKKTKHPLTLIISKNNYNYIQNSYLKNIIMDDINNNININNNYHFRL